MSWWSTKQVDAEPIILVEEGVRELGEGPGFGESTLTT